MLDAFRLAAQRRPRRPNAAGRPADSRDESADTTSDEARSGSSPIHSDASAIIAAAATAELATILRVNLFECSANYIYILRES